MIYLKYLFLPYKAFASSPGFETCNNNLCDFHLLPIQDTWETGERGDPTFNVKLAE